MVRAVDLLRDGIALDSDWRALRGCERRGLCRRASCERIVLASELVHCMRQVVLLPAQVRVLALHLVRVTAERVALCFEVCIATFLRSCRASQLVNLPAQPLCKLLLLACLRGELLLQHTVRTNQAFCLSLGRLKMLKQSVIN